MSYNIHDGHAMSYEYQRSSFQDLPEEIVSQILHYLDQDPPSISRGDQVPDVSLLHVQNAPLKASSCVCRAWRRIVYAQLFKCLRIPLEDVLPAWLYGTIDEDDEARRLCALAPDWSTGFVPITEGELWLPSRALEFLDFTVRERLGPHLDSLTLYTSSEVIVGVNTYPEEATSRVGHMSKKSNFMKLHKDLAATSLWRHLFAYLDPERVIVFAPPVTLGSLIKNCVVEQSDAWAFEIQCQRLELRQTRSSEPSPTIATASTRLPPLRRSRSPAPDLLEHRPWTSFSYHGGSCMNAYGTYHYFEKMPPCILTYNPLVTTVLGEQLTHFTYTSVFAHYVHFRGITTLISRLDALESLTLQLAPAAGSVALDDIDLISKGHMSLRDCWMEVERSYTELIRTLLCRLPEPVMPLLVKFTSYDCAKGALKEELETLFTQHAPAWTRVSEFTWQCK